MAKTFTIIGADNGYFEVLKFQPCGCERRMMTEDIQFGLQRGESASKRHRRLVAADNHDRVCSTVAKPATIGASHCQQCGSTDVEDLTTGDQGYTACCNERVVWAGMCGPPDCSHD